ncbi:MAG: ferritin-like domain-containing protein [Burkholderiales bacterium]|nr:ferritin-like domain-containing protein [Burkholderiales bacterium]MDR4517400.1 ferritin-like domain-containing protein [Nitrosomonas sp.]
MDTLKEQDRWMMSFYRYSEINGALFFGKIAAMLPPGPIQTDLNKHFADESMHSWYWTKAMEALDYKPIKIRNAYQDAYLEAGGLPVNMMEILALTNVFEKRVLKQYFHHMKLPGIHPVIKDTIELIAEDEKWHIQWINKALDDMREKYGADKVNRKIQHYKNADEEIYRNFVIENQQRLDYVMHKSASRI